MDSLCSALYRAPLIAAAGSNESARSRQGANYELSNVCPMSAQCLPQRKATNTTSNVANPTIVPKKRSVGVLAARLLYIVQRLRRRKRIRDR